MKPAPGCRGRPRSCSNPEAEAVQPVPVQPPATAAVEPVPLKKSPVAVEVEQLKPTVQINKPQHFFE